MTIAALDQSEFVYASDGYCYTGAPNHWKTGHVWWLYETAEPSVYVVIEGPHWDADEDGPYPAYEALLVLTPDGERPATEDEAGEWHDWANDEVRELTRD